MGKYRVLYILAVTFYFFLYLWTNEKTALLLLCLLILFPLAAVLFAGVRIKTLRMEISVPAACEAGENVSIHFCIKKNIGGFAGQITCPVRVYNYMFSREYTHLVSMTPGCSLEMSFALPLKTDSCGKTVVAVEEIYGSDVFGLFQWKKKIKKEQTLWIYPKKIKFHLTLKQRPLARNEGQIFDERRKGSDVTEFFDVREFQRGDSLRFAHWKLSSKLDTLMMREFSRPSSFETILLFDLAESKEISEKKAGMILSITSALMDALLEQSVKHRLGCIAGGKLLEISVGSKEDRLEALRMMVNMQAGKYPSGLIAAFMGMGRQRRYTKVILVAAKIEEQMKKLSDEVNLSVIIPSEDEKEYEDYSAGYEVIALSEKNAKKEWFLHI